MAEPETDPARAAPLYELAREGFRTCLDVAVPTTEHGQHLVSDSFWGLHRTLACFDCHKNGNFVGLSAQCAGCHRDDALAKDPAHQGYTTCANCHNPNFWSPQGAGTPAVFGRESVCR